MKKAYKYTTEEVKNIIQTAQWVERHALLRIIDKYLDGPYTNERLDLLRIIKQEVEEL